MNSIIPIISKLPSDLNLVSGVFNAIRDIAYYQKEIKALELEQFRIKKEAEVYHHRINAKLEESLRKIESDQKIAIKKLKNVEKNLKSIRLDKKNLIECIKTLTKTISKKGIPVDEKNIAHQTIIILSNTLKDMGHNSSIQLGILMNETKITLEPIVDTKFLKE